MTQSYKVLYTFLIVVLFCSFGCGNSTRKSDDKTTQQSDKKSIEQVDNTYKTVKIGTQEWMAENLNVSNYRNGDDIPQVQDKNAWANLTSGAWCYYENKSENGKIYGKLYNWYAVNDPRGLAPKGWHIPSDAEWAILTDHLGGRFEAGGKLKATKLWKNPNAGASNSSGFTALPAGLRYVNGDFTYLGTYGCFWTSSEENNFNAVNRTLYYVISDIVSLSDYKIDGLSCRCVKDY